MLNIMIPAEAVLQIFQGRITIQNAKVGKGR